MTGFEEIYALGVASKASSPNYAVAIAAFKKAYKLDPRRKVRSGKKPDPGLFEVPTRLAAAYRLNGQLYEAQRMYEWVLEHQDSRFARVGLAAVHEDNRKHVQALQLYESVLDRYPSDTYALRGVARTLASLGRVEEATDAYEKAAEAGEGRKNTAAVILALEKMRDELVRKGEADRAKHVVLALERLRDSERSTQWMEVRLNNAPTIEAIFAGGVMRVSSLVRTYRLDAHLRRVSQARARRHGG
jgi:tetratricopeptide (TPR) repeat protein